MFLSLYDLSLGTLLHAAPEEPITTLLDDTKVPFSLAHEGFPSAAEPSTLGGKMNMDQAAAHGRRRSVRFSKTSSSLHMPPIEELSECNSAESPTSTFSAHSAHVKTRSFRKYQSSHLPMGHKSRRRRVHQLLMEDYAHRQHQQIPPAAPLSPTTISPSSSDECSLSVASFSDVSSLSCD